MIDPPVIKKKAGGVFLPLDTVQGARCAKGANLAEHPKQPKKLEGKNPVFLM